MSTSTAIAGAPSTRRATFNVRGALLRESVEWLGQLLALRRTTPMALESRLEPGDMALLTRELHPDAWYDVDAAARIEAALVCCHGGSAREVMREVGRRRAQRLLDRWPCPLAGLSGRAHAVDPADLLALAAPIDFGAWRSEGRPLPSLRLRLSRVGRLPDTTRYLLEGLLARIVSELLGTPHEVTSERPSACRVVYSGAGPLPA